MTNKVWRQLYSGNYINNKMATNPPEKIKVLMFGWEFPPRISGGLGTACYGLTKALSTHKNLEVTFVVPTLNEPILPNFIKIIGADTVSISESGTPHYEEGNNNIKIIKIHSILASYLSAEEYLKIKNQKLSADIKPIATDKNGVVTFTGDYGENLFDEVHNYAAVAKAIALENDFDVIHVHDWLTFKAGIVAKEITGKPLIVHIHSTEIDRNSGNSNSGIFELEKMGMDAADQIITVSKRSKKSIIELYNQSPEKITTIYNAVEPIKPKHRNHTSKKNLLKTVAFLGRITAQKGPAFFVEAASIVLKRMKNVRFVMAGSGDLLHEIITLVAQKKISDKFHFTGFLEGKEVYDLLHTSDVYVMPSTSEPFGISTLEAIQANVPVIISKQAGVGEVITSALQINYWDVEALADAIHALLTYPALAKSIQLKTKEELGKLSWNFSALEVKKLYEQLSTEPQSNSSNTLNA